MFVCYSERLQSNHAVPGKPGAGARPAASRIWLAFALVTTVFWGVWGALIEIPEKAGFPATLGYVVWSLTMVPCAGVALAVVSWKLDRTRRDLGIGLLVGILGAAGQVILFQALRLGPAYLIFPIVSLYPFVTVLLSLWLLKEKASRRAWAGIVLAFPAIALLSYTPPSAGAAHQQLWLLLTIAVFLMWGVQAYFMKFATNRMQPESLFFYMAAGGILLAPFAVLMTNFDAPINYGFRGAGAAALVQVLNAIGALTLVYAMRFGKAIIVVPMTALAPVLTVILSLVLYRVVPHPLVIAGLVAASIAMVLMAD